MPIVCNILLNFAMATRIQLIYKTNEICSNSVLNAKYFNSMNTLRCSIFSGSVKYLYKLIQYNIFANCSRKNRAGSREVSLITENTFIADAENDWCHFRLLINNQLRERNYYVMIVLRAGMSLNR